MATTLHFTLPLPPGINNAYVTVGRRRVLSKTAKAYKADVRKLVERLRLDGKITVQEDAALQGSLLGVYFTFHFVTPYRRDLDGGLKIALDSLCEPLNLDDRMVVSIQLEKRVDTLHPRLEIELETIDDWSFDPQYVLLDAPDSAVEDETDTLE
jgi:crossover junction endodeoxyribonuclease RusA